MKTAAIQGEFSEKFTAPIGRVRSVDTAIVIIDVSDLEKLRKLQVNHLVALQSSKVGQHLIGLITKIMRKSSANEELDEMDVDNVTVENIVKVTMIGTHIDKVGSIHNVFRRTLETVPEIDAECFVIEGESLSFFMRSIAITSSDLASTLSLGTYTLDEEAEAFLDGNKLFQRHAVIVGSTGTGKSWAVARLIEQASILNSVNIIVFDIHGEYSTMQHSNLRHFRIGSDDGKDSHETISLPYWLLLYEEMVALLIDRSDQNAPNQAMVFSREVIDAKRRYLEESNHNDVLASFTIDSPIPYDINNVLDRLNVLDTQMIPGSKAGTEKQGAFFSKLSRFIQRLEAKKADKRLGFLFPSDDSTMKYEWMHELCKSLLTTKKVNSKSGVKVIDFSEIPSDILPLMTGLVARLIFSIQQWTTRESRHPIAIICDEAHLYMPQNSTGSVDDLAVKGFERIAKEGRKYGVGLVVVSQRPAEVNRTVLSQCNNFISLRLTNSEDQTVVKRLLPDNMGGFADMLPILDIGEALVVGDASILPSRIKITEPTMKPSSATINFWDEWSKPNIKTDIIASIEAFRRQNK